MNLLFPDQLIFACKSKRLIGHFKPHVNRKIKIFLIILQNHIKKEWQVSLATLLF